MKQVLSSVFDPNTRRLFNLLDDLSLYFFKDGVSGHVKPQDFIEHFQTDAPYFFNVYAALFNSAEGLVDYHKALKEYNVESGKRSYETAVNFLKVIEKVTERNPVVE